MVIILLLSGKIFLLNIEILIFFRLNIYKGGLYEYNDPSNNELSVFTGQFPLPKGKQK